MQSQRETSLKGGAMMLFAGFFGIVFFVFNPNVPFVSVIQYFFGHQVTLGFLQVMSFFTVVGGIVLLVHGARSPDY